MIFFKDVFLINKYTKEINMATKNNSRINKMLNSISNRSNMNYTSKSWLYCRWILYVVFVLAIGNIYYLLLSGDYFTLAIFVLVAFLTTFFSKNMVVILCISLVISTIIKSVQLKEGLELSKNDVSTIETLMDKFGGSGIKEGVTTKNKDSKKSSSNEDNNEHNDSKSKSKSNKEEEEDKADKADKADKEDKEDKKNKNSKKDTEDN